MHIQKTSGYGTNRHRVTKYAELVIFYPSVRCMSVIKLIKYCVSCLSHTMTAVRNCAIPEKVLFHVAVLITGCLSRDFPDAMKRAGEEVGRCLGGTCCSLDMAVIGNSGHHIASANAMLPWLYGFRWLWHQS